MVPHDAKEVKLGVSSWSGNRESYYYDLITCKITRNVTCITFGLFSDNLRDKCS